MTINLEEFLSRTGLKMRHIAEKMDMKESKLRYHLRGNFRDGKKDKRGTETAQLCAQAIKEVIAEAVAYADKLALGSVVLSEVVEAAPEVPAEEQPTVKKAAPSKKKVSRKVKSKRR